MTIRKYTHRTPEQWQVHLDQQAESGLSIKDYCKEQNLAPSNFYGWRKRLNSTEDEAASVDKGAWVALASEPTHPPEKPVSTETTLVLPGGIELTIRSYSCC